MIPEPTSAPASRGLQGLSPASRWWLPGVLAACMVAALVAYLAGRGSSQAPLTGPGAAKAPAAPTTSTPKVDRFVFGVTPALPRATPELLPAESATVFAFAPWPAGLRRDEVQGRWSWQAGPMMDAPVAAVRAPGGAVLARLTLEKSPVGPLGPGVGEVELRARGHRAAHGCFVLAADAPRILSQKTPPTAQTAVTSLLVGRGLGPDGRVTSPQGAFAPNERVYASFVFTGADAGADFVVHWYAEDNELQRARKVLPVEAAAGVGNAWIQARGKGLPPGHYRVSVCYGADPVPLAQTQWEVVPGRKGQAPEPTPAAKATPAGAGAPPRSRN